MKVIVDTDVWSEAFRKKSGRNSLFCNELELLVQESRVQMIGPIRMEILCGLKDAQVFERIENSLRAFPDRVLDSEVFVLASKFFNLCRSKGIQGSNTDFIICACSVLWKSPILSKDKDYGHYRKLLPIEQAEPRKS